jgi:hypothetical protein
MPDWTSVKQKKSRIARKKLGGGDDGVHLPTDLEEARRSSLESMIRNDYTVDPTTFRYKVLQ